MTDLTFSKTERKQIALRFNTLYGLITAKTWTAGNMGIVTEKDSNGDEVEREIEQDQLRGLGKKKNKPKELKMCLVGAAAFVNGPTEEEILALLATQIIIEGGGYALGEVWDWMKEKREYSALCTGEQNDGSCALVLFEQLLKNKPFDGALSLAQGAGSSEDVIIEFNDGTADGEYKKVKALIKRAMKLYDKLEKVWQVEQKYANILALRDKDFGGLGKLFA